MIENEEYVTVPKTSLDREMNFAKLARDIKAKKELPLAWLRQLSKEEINRVKGDLYNARNTDKVNTADWNLKKEEWNKFFDEQLNLLKNNKSATIQSTLASTSLPSQTPVDIAGRDRQYNAILSSSKKDVSNQQGYIGGMAVNLLSQHSILDEGLQQELKKYPTSHALIVLGGFYDSLYDQRNGIFKSEAPTKPEFKDESEKINFLKFSIQEGIAKLKSSATDKSSKDFVQEFENLFTKFNSNLEQMNKSMNSDPIAEARRLATINIKQSIGDSFFLQDDEGRVLLSDKEIRREILKPILDKIKLPPETLEVCSRNSNILTNEIFGNVLQPVINKVFGADKGGIDLNKLKDPTNQEKFAQEANLVIPKFLSVIDPLSKHKDELPKSFYNIVKSRHISNIAEVKTSEDLTTISNKINSEAIISLAISKSGIKIEDKTNEKINNILSEKLQTKPGLKDNIQEFSTELSKTFTKKKKVFKSKNQEDSRYLDDLTKIIDDAITKYDKSAMQQKESKQKTPKSSFIDKMAHAFNLTNLSPSDAHSKDSKKTPKDLTIKNASPKMEKIMAKAAAQYASKDNNISPPEKSSKVSRIGVNITRPTKSHNKSPRIAEKVLSNQMLIQDKEEVRQAGNKLKKHVPHSVQGITSNTNIESHRVLPVAPTTKPHSIFPVR